MKKVLLIAFFSLFFAANVFAAERVVNLTVAYKTVNFAGKSVQAIAVNNQIPAPTLHFKEGDHVTINVYNKLDKETAIHWHGMLVPWQMDGVLGISQKGIQPGKVFQYQFTLHQGGTYWYHAHAGLQEQQGLYGAFVIDPKPAPHFKYTKDFVVVLSDWSNTNPDQIYANLKKDGDYYSPNFPLQPSLLRFIRDYKKADATERKQLIDDYKMMQQMRMSLYDLSDVAYDSFLLNGRPRSNPWIAQVKVGDVVRLRFIGAGAGTIFHVKIPGTTMQMVHVEGNDVKAYPVNDFKIAPGETYDILVKIEKDDPYIIYAESADTVGATVGALVTTNSPVNFNRVTPFPEPPPVTREMMNGMGHSMNHSMSMPMDHSMHMNHDMQNMQMDKTTQNKYDNVTAAVKTNDPNKPIKETIKMELSGWMGRYIWFINGVPGYNAKPIKLEPAQRYRIIFTNTSMMHHPMHIHGHWFILRNGHGAYDPLLHTIDVPPGGTVVADLDTDASGQWFFHCHFLYHMMAGMSRVFQYGTLIELTENKIEPEDTVEKTAYQNRPIVRVDEVRPIDPHLVTHPMPHGNQFYFSSLLEFGEDPFHNAQQLNFKGLYGTDFNKLELFINDAEMKKGTAENADIDIFYWHLIDQFWAIKGGVNYMNRPANTPYWQPGIGIEGLMPYFIETDLRTYYHRGSVKFDLELSRDFQITNNFFMRADIRSILATKSVRKDEVGSGLNQMRYIARPYYRVMPGLNLFTEYEHDQDYGKFKDFHQEKNDDTSEDTITFGFSYLF